MDPEETADALAVRAGRHVCGDLEVVVQVPRAGMDDAEDDKIFRLDVVEIRLVGDTQGAACSVAGVVGVDRRRRLTGASEVRVLVANVATVCQVCVSGGGCAERRKETHPGADA